MKKLYCALLLLFALTLPVFAAGEEISIHPDSHWLVRDTDGELQVLTDDYVLDFHADPESGIIWYTALEEGQALLRSLQPDGEIRTVPLEREEGELILFSQPAQSTEKMVDAAMTIIYRNEGNYGSINRDDNGALSIGKVQWHGNRALNLLKTILKDDGQLALEILGEDLYQEILTEDSWGSRTVNEEEALAISQLLKTEKGKAAQDALAAEDITSYVNHALNLGLRSGTAIVYFADLENQWGYYGAKNQAKKAMEAAGSYEAVTLDILHQACLNYTTKYHTRRNNVYQYCLSLGWDSFTLLAPGRPAAQVAGATVRLSWEQVEHAESYECFIKVVQNGFTDVCSVETTDTFCTVMLEPEKDYCAYVVAKSQQVQSDSSLWALFSTTLPGVEGTAAVMHNPETGETVVEIEYTLYHHQETHRVLAAGYREGRLVAIKMAAWNEGEHTVALTGAPDEVRLFMIDSAFNWMPLCERQVLDCTPEPAPDAGGTGESTAGQQELPGTEVPGEDVA